MRDLLGSDRFDQGFVVELERDGRARLRFGDDIHGRRPAPARAFDGAWSARRRRRRQRRPRRADRGRHRPFAGIERVDQPAARRGRHRPGGGRADVRQHAPAAFATQERAVTDRRTG